MLVKFNSRGAGGGAGPIDYLLGKNRDREKALLLRGNVEQTKQLIDSLSFARNYTSGTLSFSEEDIPEHRKQEIMDDFERMIFAGLDSNQYDILWIEHRDKDRLELNFLIPNVELRTGKRLQPYYDKVDRKRVNSWQQITNDSYNFTDPHDPARKRFNVTAHDIPNDKQKATEIITKSLANLVEIGVVKSRADVIEQLKKGGFEVARETKSSISIKDPSGSKNIRLKGALYERDFRFSEETRAAIERANRTYQEQREQRLSFVRGTFKKAHQAKCSYNEKRYSTRNQINSEFDQQSFIKNNVNIHARTMSGRNTNVSNAIHSQDITNSALKNKVEKNDRIRTAISNCISTISKTIRAAITRDIRASSRIERESDLVNELKTKQFKQRKKQRTKTIERASDLNL